ncbi:MAG: 50S ribosomal protein L22 [Chloroflexi bacterium ADurb.Bin180]|jgi:large subunit ribosomal protein L22|nr:MAG: 50S ribosomal protein L22 [Chloroflexi bacterium ADurb.Bin180]HOU24331.1 50S ribosomal protein L22 [Anaerolineae bacterium]HQJ52355.1 50S ribosomal protein L22 [Anaerolineae bacterium]
MALEVKAVAKYIRMSPMKVQLVVDMVRGKGVNEALAILKYSTRAGAEPVLKAINSAAANAEENYGLSRNELVVSSICADEGPTYKRMRFGGRGHMKPILKRSTHITVVLAGPEAAQ